MTIVVRPIREIDVGAAVRVMQGGSLTPDSEDAGDLAPYWEAVTETRRRRGDVLVADDHGEVVGVLQVMVFPHFQHHGGWCAELESVHVRGDRRSQGIGGLLLDAAEELARRAGCYRVQLTSRHVRLDAHRFYVAHGFEAVSQGFKKSL